MKYYEVTDPYYALIAASDENEAKAFYARFVDGEIVDDLQPAYPGSDEDEKDSDVEYEQDEEGYEDRDADVFTMAEITEDEARQKYEAREDMEPGEPRFEQLIAHAERHEKSELLLIDYALI